MVVDLKGIVAFFLFKFRRCTKWKERIIKEKGLKGKDIAGPPVKNKVDNQIKKNARKMNNNKKNMDILVIVSSDGDYADIVRESRERGKRVVIIADKKVSKKLKGSCSELIEI